MQNDGESECKKLHKYRESNTLYRACKARLLESKEGGAESVGEALHALAIG